MVAFAGVQYRLLGAGGLVAPPGPRSGSPSQSQAITNTLPGGGAIAAVYGFRWYRRLGADDPLAAWAMVGCAVASWLSLALVAAVGLALATELGASLDLIPVVAGVLALALAAGVVFVYERPLAAVVNWSLRTSKRLIGRPSGDLEANIERVVKRVTVVRLHRRQIVAILGWGMGNWLFDCALCLLVPHGRGRHPVEGAPARLRRRTAGGQPAGHPRRAGAVEGSITIALAYFGGATGEHGRRRAHLPHHQLLGVIIVGWTAWAWGAIGVRRGRWPRYVLTAPADAEVSKAAATEMAMADPAPAMPRPPWEVTGRSRRRHWRPPGRTSKDVSGLDDCGGGDMTVHGANRLRRTVVGGAMFVGAVLGGVLGRGLHRGSQRVGDGQQRLLPGAPLGRGRRPRCREVEGGAAGQRELAPLVGDAPLRRGTHGTWPAPLAGLPSGVSGALLRPPGWRSRSAATVAASPWSSSATRTTACLRR